MITIRRAGLEDLDTLVQMGSQTIIESHGSSAPQEVMNAYVSEKFTEASMREELSDPLNIFHIIRYNQQPAGYSKIIYNVPIEAVASTQITKMERLYLLRSFYDKRLGHYLMQFNIELSKEQQQQGMWLYVWKGNERAIRFYEKTGFTIVGDGSFRLTDEHANPNWQMYLQY